MRRLLLLAVAGLWLAGCGSSKDAAQTTATHAPSRPKPPSISPAKPPTGAVTVKISSATHTPKVNTPWRYTVRVTAEGKPVPARVSVVVTYQGRPALNLGTHEAPHGVWSGTVQWPGETRAKLVVLNARAESEGRTGIDHFQVAGQ